jgi:hypothetical protein
VRVTCPAHLLDFTLFGKAYKMWGSLLYTLLHAHVN